MLILALLIVAVPLIWIFMKRTHSAAARRAGISWAIIGLGAALALRFGPLPMRLLALAAIVVVGFAVWLRRRGGGGGGGGDDPPAPDPDPDPGDHAKPHPKDELLDRDAFDVAREEWERELPRRS